MLNDEDFDDDTKDAGEMGAGHRVTALYEIIPADSAAEVGSTDLKYQQSQVVESDEWLNIKIRYKDPDQDQSKLLSLAVDSSQESHITSESFDFASGVAEFGMLMRDSQFKGNGSYENIYGRIVGLPSVKTDPYKAEFLSLVEMLME
jgi:Ca-activated chloride channel family protein